MTEIRTYEELLADNERLRWQLDEATETIEAIRTGQIDALVVADEGSHALYTLRTADQAYRVFIESMNEGAITLSSDGLILYGNSMFATMVDWPLSQVIGLPFDRFVMPDCQPDYLALFTHGWTEKRRLELTLRNRAGQPVPCLLSATPLALEEGASLSVILTDLTAQQEAQRLLRLNNERLERTIKALEVSNNALNLSNDNLQQFAYVASHDLQEPLRKIKSFGDLLRSTYGPALGPDGIDMINRMGVAAARMSLLISDLLNYSRLTTQQIPFSPVQLDQLLADVLDDLSVTVAEWDAVIELSELPTVLGDQRQLQQLFQNLLSNALKFRRPDAAPHVRVTARQVAVQALPPSVLTTLVPDSDPNRLFHEISVTDNGIGFDEKYLDRIFQVFQRLHGRSNYSGSGVGLAICRKVAMNHQGGLTARSQPGIGATFLLYLPV